MRRFTIGTTLTVLAAAPAGAAEFGFVGNGALDQPRVNATVRVQPVAGEASTEMPLASDSGDLADLFESIGVDPSLLSPHSLSVFFDTGAGVGLFGGMTADTYGIPRQEGAVFADIGVGGLETFDVSQRLTIQIASSAPGLDLSDLSNYRHVYTDIHAAVGHTPKPTNALDPIDNAIDQVIHQYMAAMYDFNVLGMPFFEDKVVVMDARALNAFVNEEVELSFESIPQLFTHVYDHDDPPAWNPSNVANPGVPTPAAIDLTIEANFANFSHLTFTEGGTPPTLAKNPMIGGVPEHLRDASDLRDDGQGVTITRGSASSTGTWLFDTGAAATIISTKQANALGVFYAEDAGPESGSPLLMDEHGVALEEQFELQLGGVGGTLTVAGFLLDRLSIPAFADYFGAQAADELAFLDAPVLVADIAIEDEASDGGRYVLDGILGMNFFLASTYIDGAIDPTGTGQGTPLGALPLLPGNFDFIVYDEANNLIHLSIVPEPAALALLLGSMLAATVRRRRA